MSPRYVPSDDDVLKARLKTLGVVEHTFSLETGKERGVDWKIYDVGGYVCMCQHEKFGADRLSWFLVHEVKYFTLLTPYVLLERLSHSL